MAIKGYTSGIPENRAQAYGATRTAANHNQFVDLWPSRELAKRAYRKYLIEECGYKPRENPSELLGPDGYVHVLPKTSQFGGAYRTGKAERAMPKMRTGGTIINL